MTATDNDTDKNFNEKNLICTHHSSFRRCLKTTAATSSPALMRTTAPHPIRSITTAPPTGPIKVMGPTATWQEPPTLTNTDHADITTLETCYRHHPSICAFAHVCVCIWVYVEDLNNIACLVLEVLSRFKWMQFCYQFDSLLISSRSLDIFIYIFASNCTQWVITALLSVQPTLCLANESIPLYGVSMLL